MYLVYFAIAFRKNCVFQVSFLSNQGQYSFSAISCVKVASFSRSVKQIEFP